MKRGLFKDKVLGFKGLTVLSLVLILLTIVNSIFMVRPDIVYAENTNDAVANMQINAGGDGSVTADVINEWYESTSRKDGLLAGKGEDIVEVADKYGINRAFFVALMDAETTSGLNACFSNDYNFGCIRGNESSSVDEGLEDLGQLVSKYVDGSKSTALVKNPTVQQFTDVYAPAIENDHASRFKNHGAVFGYLGVDADEMQSSGELKNGEEASAPDYSVDGGSSKSLAASCPINCNLADNQKSGDDKDGSNTGHIQYLPKGELWKNAEKLQDTDVGYTTDQVSKDNLEEFIGTLTKGGDAESLASSFYDAGIQSGLDPRFLVAFWSVSTVNGTSEAWESSYNSFGWATGDDFGSEREGIVEGAKLISVNYYNEGQKTLNDMVESDSGHIVSSDEDWAKAVASIMKKSEDTIKESTGNLPKDTATISSSEAISEQCYGNGTKELEDLPGSNYTEQVINQLKAEGFTHESISGILGNMQKESGVSPTRIQGHTYETSENMTDEERDTALKKKTNGAYAAGIVQWEEPRFNTVRAKASELGVSPFTMEPQMSILSQELKAMSAGSYGSGTLYDFYKTNTDIYTATASFAQLFERCKACRSGTGEFEQRTGMSKEYFSTYFE